MKFYQQIGGGTQRTNEQPDTKDTEQEIETERKLQKA